MISEPKLIGYKRQLFSLKVWQEKMQTNFENYILDQTICCQELPSVYQYTTNVAWLDDLDNLENYCDTISVDTFIKGTLCIIFASK